MNENDFVNIVLDIQEILKPLIDREDSTYIYIRANQSIKGGEHGVDEHVEVKGSPEAVYALLRGAMKNDKELEILFMNAVINYMINHSSKSQLMSIIKILTAGLIDKYIDIDGEMNDLATEIMKNFKKMN